MKKKALLIAEKNSAAKAINSVYQRIKDELRYEITITAAAGHIITLYEPDEYIDKDWGKPWKKEVLPMIPQKWETKVIQDKQKYFDNIKRLWESGKYEVVINAGDAGREGQLIQSYIYKKIGIKVPVLRFWASDLTDKTIERELKNLKDNREYTGLEQAAYLRADFDWLVGMNFSRAATISLDRLTVIGRVMSAVLYMIVKRELAIRSFKPIAYYELKVQFRAGKGIYEGYLVNPNADNTYPTPYAFLFNDKLNDVVKTMSDKGIVSEVSHKEVINYAPRLYNQTDLQKDCANCFGYTPSKTLSLAQSLYEKKMLSYPRTESRYLNKVQEGDIRSILDALVSLGYPQTDQITDTDIEQVFNSDRYANDKKVSDHPALTPTGKYENITEDEKRVYDLIVRRFTSIFLPPQKSRNDVIITTCGDLKFKTVGNTILDLGYAILLNDNRDNSVCEVSESEQVYTEGKCIIPRETTAPKRYTDATILTAMQTAGKDVEDDELENVLNNCNGLGTAATRADILAKLQAYGYVLKDKNHLYPSDEGLEQMNMLDRFDFIHPDLTAQWEDKLLNVENGKLPPGEFMIDMIKYVSLTTRQLLSLPQIGPYKRRIANCPKCGSPFWEYHGCYACEGKSKGSCDFTLPKKLGNADITSKDITEMIAGNASSAKKFVWKDGSKTKGRLCITSDFKLSFSKNIVGKCPLCGKNILEGKAGYYCEGWSRDEKGNSIGCDFTVYGKIGNIMVTPAMAVEIFKSGMTKKAYTITYKSGKSFFGHINCQQDSEGKYWFNAISDLGKVCNCPFCDDGEINEKTGFYECSNRKKTCDFMIVKKFYGAQITSNDIKKLLIERTDIQKMLHFKNGTKAKKFLRIKKTPDRGYIYVWEQKGDKL